MNGNPLLIYYYSSPLFAEDLHRRTHGGHIQNEFNSAVEAFDGEDFVYLVFKSAWDFLLDIDKLNDNRGDFRLASYKEIINVEDGAEHKRVEATVYLNRRAIGKFLRKVEQYIQENTQAGNPKNLSLTANIEEIQAATLESFWQEPELRFPDIQERRWWEVWLTRNDGESIESLRAFLVDVFEDSNIQLGEKVLLFPEHFVLLLNATGQGLGQTLLYTDRLSELRQLRDTADFFTALPRQEQQEWAADLTSRVDIVPDSTISVCLLDTGVNRTNPLLTNLIPARNLESVNPAWTTADTHLHGHGTPMAGLTFYGDLAETLASRDRITIYHQLESVKLIERGNPHSPELYGSVTQEAVARGIILNPRNKRIVCMAITSDSVDHKGKPTSWSSAIDQLLFGTIDERNTTTLFLVSSGNVPSNDRMNYPLSNADCSINDPAQSFNSITVGSYTLKDAIDQRRFPNATLLANRGAMSPCNSTSLCWNKAWCKKPDIVMEGGNEAIWNGGTIDPDSLLLLSTGLGGNSIFTTFGDTSGATALASKFAAELYSSYPRFWPETIRALIIHSADWTPAMLGNRNIQQLSSQEKKDLLSKVGYGVPNMQKARYSATNSLTLIAEKNLRPFRVDGSQVKTDEFHLFNLPWPSEALRQLFDTTVKVKITISYYIEPNPGSRSYDLATSYRSFGLRFKMIDRNESIEAFRARISRTMRNDDYQQEGTENWLLGSLVRDKGSIHKDIWEGSAADLITRNRIAVYPVNGWWRTRKKLQRFNSSIRYSIIVSIETPNEEVDIYTPVLNEIAIPV
ncbi:S8 family peptidase [Paracnuella aquatica]|uniref:S8 family peptidase n=1 Tax=Paracnuella aquatica TaxID=2268757 RepID=UPI000DEF6827|nr:S8 family peptidase [Paracnuella aquatica]RPD44495.1 S8 family peptidase [Paracnuella aquatica]